MNIRDPKSEIPRLLSAGGQENLKIIFMGTPGFAVASLEALLNAGYNIVGVVTAPDKPAGRGMQMQASAVKIFALNKGLEILQPEKLKATEFMEKLKALHADLQVVVAFRMLPEIVWNMPLMGTLNVHASLLPQYRGAAPINWAIINGEKETGVTIFKLQQQIDTGNVLSQEKIQIGENETAGELYDRLKVLGADLLVKTIQGIVEGSIHEHPQSLIPDSQFSLKHAPKIFTETCKIDWNKNADEIFNLIRGLSPWPGAFTHLDDKVLKIYSSSKEICAHHFANGSLHSDKKNYLKFACADGFIHCKDIQLQGKKRMAIKDFLRGYRMDD